MKGRDLYQTSRRIHLASVTLNDSSSATRQRVGADQHEVHPGWQTRGRDCQLGAVEDRDRKRGVALCATPLTDPLIGQPKIRPLVFEIAAAWRFWTSSQFTTFQKALT